MTKILHAYSRWHHGGKTLALEEVRGVVKMLVYMCGAIQVVFLGFVVVARRFIQTRRGVP